MTTQDESDAGEATFIGLIEKATPPAAHPYTAWFAQVVVFFVSNAGFLMKPVLRKIQANQLRISSGAEEMRIVSRAKALSAAKKAQRDRERSELNVQQQSQQRVQQQREHAVVQPPHAKQQQQQQQQRAYHHGSSHEKNALKQQPNRATHVLTRMYQQHQNRTPYAKQARDSTSSQIPATRAPPNTSTTSHATTERTITSTLTPQSKIPRYARSKYSQPDKQQPISTTTAAVMLVKRLCRRVSPNTPIGYLPDGRAVCWFQSDPKAVYVRSSGETTACSANIQQVQLRRYVSSIRKANALKAKNANRRFLVLDEEKKFPCLWGCSSVSKSPSSHSRRERCVLAFSNKNELVDHLKQYHPTTYVDHPEMMQEISRKEDKWIRVSEGNDMRQLCADLSAALCARCLELSSLVGQFNDTTNGDAPQVDSDETTAITTKKPASTISDMTRGFSQSPYPIRIAMNAAKVLDMTVGGRGAIKFSSNGFVMTSLSLQARGMMRLWSRLYRLFALELEGSFRLSLDESPFSMKNSLSKTVMELKNNGGVEDQGDSVPAAANGVCTDVEKEEKKNAGQEDIVRPDVDPPHDEGNKHQQQSQHVPNFHRQLCISATLKPAESKKSPSCLLCMIPGEKAVRTTSCTTPVDKAKKNDQNGEGPLGAESPSNIPYSGIGCALLTEAMDNSAGNQCKLFRNYLSSQPPPEGKLDMVRNLLFKVASRIPKSLRKKHVNTVPNSLGYDKIIKCSIWEDQIWIKFVATSTNGIMLMQAFVVMVSSIALEKMPKWWRNLKNGWHSVYVAMHTPTLSSLSLRLFVFDAAVAEFMTGHATPAKKSKGHAVSGGKNNTAQKSAGNGKRLINSLVDNPKKNKTRRIERHARKMQIEHNPDGNKDGKSKKNNPELLGFWQVKDMTEFLGQDVVDESLKRLMKIDMEVRMIQVITWAKRLFAKRFEGVHNDNCLVCDTGGELMCCEFCNNVQHAKCCTPPLKKPPEFDWVCEECISDINVNFLYHKKTNGRQGGSLNRTLGRHVDL